MNILIVGSGAREHAIAKAVNRSTAKKTLYCLGTNQNPGLQSLCFDLQTIDINNNKTISDYAVKNKINLAIIGPENPLANGVSDSLMSLGIKVVGPTKDLAKIESSKSFARKLFQQTMPDVNPKHSVFESMNGAQRFLQELGSDFVIKYDGLAGGKGVKVSGDHLHSHQEALEYCDQLIKKGGSFIIEEKLIGEEFSLMIFCDGASLKHMPAVQDHKRAFDGDLGPNTGGMGTYSDANHSLPFLTNSEIKEAQKINETAAAALKEKSGVGYKGVLYGGFMATSTGVKLIEYNARLGDPEAMNVLTLLDTDFIDICLGITDGVLNNKKISFLKKASVCKYAVPNGYPNKPIKEKEISTEKIKNKDGLHFASVNIKENKLMLAGSRAVAVVATASTIAAAEAAAEKEICNIAGPLFHRKDIGTTALVEKKVNHMKEIK